jgi:hypothetical protein
MISEFTNQRNTNKTKDVSTRTSTVIFNNAQEVQLDVSYNLYENPNKRVTLIPQEILYDTGAGLTMISGQHPWAWANLHECMYAIGGCFVGKT